MRVWPQKLWVLYYLAPITLVGVAPVIWSPKLEAVGYWRMAKHLVPQLH